MYLGIFLVQNKIHKKEENKMPQTKFQDYTFTIIMVLLMVYCMTIYNNALAFGFTYDCFRLALENMWPEAIAAFVIVRLIANPLVGNLMHYIIDVKTAKKTTIAIVRAGCTAFFMCPCMTLFVTILHNGLHTNLLLLWLPKIIVNFPFALFLQIFYLGPLVRLIFRTLFKRQLIIAGSNS
jgi:hypothetical protein